MNPNLLHLVRIAQQPARRIIGLMSGTSLDGLDVALCRCEGSGLHTRVQVERFHTVPYPEEVKNEIRQVFAKADISFEQLCLLNPWIGHLHADMVLDCLRQWQVAPHEVDCIASHGQTVYHAPSHQHGRPNFPNATLQLGDGDHVAVRTGILTLSDFRQKHLAAGGEGAPLAVYGDYLLFSKENEDRILLNMGGIANFTYLPGSRELAGIFSTDVGPGNTLLDAFTQHYFPPLSYDADGALATQGQVHQALLTALLDHPFFQADFPKTTGPELFNKEYVRRAQQRSGCPTLPPYDLLATLTQFSAEGIVRALERCFPIPHLTVYASGGGMHNPVLMAALSQRLPHCRFTTTDELGVLPDAKEAVLFAVLANEALAGTPETFQGGQPGNPAVSMGKISFAR
ncbi:anhydro-N-acetylmuramic acid kinase [Hymenobacter aerilatus]|uniref:Anhydro-N-acetylmuramic acid kinase n=1 Tax=Hymenobacter aerilatus TaxID=2932251 RepID=A0A8T9T4A8_9BACT|nr:anhydro-N-acetylmuramic acid kinase [Hymenobacter aerilatus]UOR07460.1 anhydro-N-acetylmuramic acid kinase [Hymenobacter aerilatus]